MSKLITIKFVINKTNAFKIKKKSYYMLEVSFFIFV